MLKIQVNAVFPSYHKSKQANKQGICRACRRFGITFVSFKSMKWIRVLARNPEYFICVRNVKNVAEDGFHWRKCKRSLCVCLCFQVYKWAGEPLTPWRQLYVSVILNKVVKTCFLKQVWGREERYFLVLLLKYVSYETGMLRGGLHNEVSQNHQVATCSRSPHPKLQLVQAVAMIDFFLINDEDLFLSFTCYLGVLLSLVRTSRGLPVPYTIIWKVKRSIKPLKKLWHGLLLVSHFPSSFII